MFWSTKAGRVTLVFYAINLRLPHNLKANKPHNINQRLKPTPPPNMLPCELLDELASSPLEELLVLLATLLTAAEELLSLERESWYYYESDTVILVLLLRK